MDNYNGEAELEGPGRLGGGVKVDEMGEKEEKPRCAHRTQCNSN